MAETDIKQLTMAMEHARRKLQPYRERRFTAVQEYVGYNYSDSGSQDRMPVNFLELAVNTYRRQIAAANPQVVVTSKNVQLEDISARFELAINKVLKEIDFDRTLQLWVFDALFSIGIMKVGISDSADASTKGFLHDAGQPYADIVDLDDFVFDIHASRWEDVQFAGNRFIVPYEEALETGLIPQSRAKDVKPTGFYSTTNEQGDQKVQSVTSGYARTGEDYYLETVELWEVWLPFENRVVLLASNDDGSISHKEPLSERDWDGPETGPYHLLRYNDVPGSIMPLPPVSVLTDLNDLSNRMFRKLGRQAERQKTVTIVQSGAEADGERILNADDGDMIRSDRPEATKEMQYGGIDQTSLAFLLQVRDMFSYMGGNLDTLAGLSPVADTLGQEQMVRSSSSQRIIDMQERTSGAVRDVIRAMGWYLWHDPSSDYEVSRQITQTMAIDTAFSANDREGDFYEHEIDIVAFSMQSRSPAERLQTLNAMLSNVLIPMAPVMAQQGKTIDFDKFIELSAKYSNVPEIAELVNDSMPMPDPASPSAAGGPAERTYTRQNVGGMGRADRDNVMSRALMGSNPQQSEMRKATQP
tara:strand:- start:3109 stop:4866 length:1758 start_codon:yes stop_codon:yes gene_type:complete